MVVHGAIDVASVHGLMVNFPSLGPFVSAKEEAADNLEGEDDGNVEEEPSPTDALSGSPTGEGESEPEDGTSLKSHPDADTHFLITKPVGMGLGMFDFHRPHFNVNNRRVQIYPLAKTFLSWLDSLIEESKICWSKVLKHLSDMPWTLVSTFKT